MFLRFDTVALDISDGPFLHGRDFSLGDTPQFVAPLFHGVLATSIPTDLNTRGESLGDAHLFAALLDSGLRPSLGGLGVVHRLLPDFIIIETELSRDLSLEIGHDPA